MFKNKKTFKKYLLLAGTLIAATIIIFTSQNSNTLEGRLVQQENNQHDPITISAEEVEKGTIFPARTLIRFQIPDSADQILRKVLLGYPDENQDYWGVCRQENSDSLQWFLSESLQEKYESAAKNPPKERITDEESTSEEIEASKKPQLKVPTIRHSLEVFSAGMDCLSSAQENWHVGADYDGDLLNNALEMKISSNQYDRDTDGDGIEDGIEIKMGTLVTDRDSDRDGIPDGLEDKNGNGYIDAGETSPLNPDSDGDGLWDGKKTTYRKKLKVEGEDLNLNGIVDKADPTTNTPCETNPLSNDTDNDGNLDDGDPTPC